MSEYSCHLTGNLETAIIKKISAVDDRILLHNNKQSKAKRHLFSVSLLCTMASVECELITAEPLV